MLIRRALIVVVAIAVAGGVVALLDEDFRKLDFLRLFGRAGWQLPDRTVSALGLEEGDRVADLGAGGGYFVDPLAAAVGPTGRVYAVEVSARALERLAEKVRTEGLTNVEVVEGGADDPRLPDAAIDLVFLCDVYHHIGERVDYFAALRADLTTDGRVAIVEPRAHGFGRLVTPGGHATPAAELIAEMDRAGYRLDQHFDFLPVQNLLIFRPDTRTELGAGTPAASAVTADPARQ